MRAAPWLAAASYITLSSAQDATNATISSDPIEKVLKSLKLIPDGLVGVAAVLLAAKANDAQDQILGTLKNQTLSDPRKLTDPEAYYSYGQSPAVYPSPQGTGPANWSTAYEIARSLVSQMTVEEKVNLTIPAYDFAGCSGFSGSVPRLGFPGVCLNDGPSGVRAGNTNHTSGFPAQIAIGASWNRTLSYWRSKQMGVEYRAKGVNVALGPVVGPLGRVAKGGRNWEGFTNDAYLAGQLVGPAVEGLQESVVACVKHFIGNEQETQRNPFLAGYLAVAGINLNNSVSANIDDQTMHELYLWPFYDAVRAGVGSVMASYNRVNNSYASQNSKLLNGLLKTELGFQGFVVSDWGGQHTGVASANAGLDMVMPYGIWWGNGQLEQAANNGSVDASRLDDMATRIVASTSRFANITNPGIAANNDTDPSSELTTQVLLEAAIEGHVLVKNVNNTLPFRSPSVISIFGYDAISGLNTSADDPDLWPNSLANTQAYAPPDDRTFGYLDFVQFSASVMGPQDYMPSIALNGTLISGGGSGGVTPSSIISPHEAIVRYALSHGTIPFANFVSPNPVVLNPGGPCIVLINAQSVESADRHELSDDYSDTLVTNVAKQCNNTVVVIHNAGIRLVDNWIENENVTAVIYAHPAGQATGDALVSILWGETSPSGRLPYTVAKKESDYGALLDPTYPTTEHPQYAQSDFDEGVVIDYRHFLKEKIEPRFPFGFGLTYSNFTYSNLSLEQHPEVDRSIVPCDIPTNSSSPHPEGGLDSLYDVLTTIRVTVENVGEVEAAEVAQLYLSIPGSAAEKVLRGFEKKVLQKGEKAEFTFDLRRRDLSLWDSGKQSWVLGQGVFGVMVGRNVLDTEGLTGGFEL
ncbi:putative beta-glucosidase [Zymoseptoria tritici IPO323]|uniref:beta-glucosidase n=1 Tax=Zymoseptoria tritici (strain CBS 115943 / IPO323) TaxID=336722 RepID=F9XBV5_ZYMTI|nr:putative beta-glucosidase [Zymoseptoria tritici IPO323]EGP87289.1 putative beta-glucosidase [Zymoseptoria tritici IPO323]